MAIEKWSFDLTHSTVGFWVRHFMVSKVHGNFSKWGGSFELDLAEPGNSKVDVQIDAASIDTRDAQRDGHLRSPDFFDVEKHPQITFKSTKVSRVGEENFKVEGDFTLHGVTKPVTLDVEYAGRSKHAQMGERAGFSAKTSISRKEFGLEWNMALEAGGIAVGDKVEINLEIEAILAPPAQA